MWQIPFNSFSPSNSFKVPAVGTSFPGKHAALAAPGPDRSANQSSTQEWSRSRLSTHRHQRQQDRQDACQ